jgi:hypothetical protein
MFASGYRFIAIEKRGQDDVKGPVAAAGQGLAAPL